MNALLVWRLLSRVGARGAAIAAAAFAIHPVQLESVAWIYEQKNVLSGVFFFASLLAYLRFEESRSRATYFLALGSFVCALLAKASTVVLPALIVLHVWCRDDRLGWRRVRPTLPFFVLGAAMALLTIWYEGAVTGADAAAFDAGWLERATRAGWVLGFHAWKLALPVDLAFFYPSWTVDPSAWRSQLPNLAFVVAFAAAWRARAGWGRPLLVGLGWYVIAMAPVAGIFDIFYHQYSLAADHFVYLGSVGLLALGAHAGVVGLERSGVQRMQLAAAAVAALLLASLWIGTWQRAHVYASNLALSRDAAAKYPTSWLAHQKAAEFGLRAARRAGNPPPMLARATRHLERAVALRPDAAASHDLLASAAFLAGDHERAARHASRAVALDSAHALYRRNLAQAHRKTGQPARAVVHLREAVSLAPESPALLLDLARALHEAGELAEARAAVARSVELATGAPGGDELLRQARQLHTLLGAELEAEARGARSGSRAIRTDHSARILDDAADSRPGSRQPSRADRVARQTAAGLL